MHMADALISPAVGGVMAVLGAGTLAYSVKKIKTDLPEKKIPLMGVMGAFVFAAQMINFTIPGTGSSGHLAGGLLLAALLGPYAGFLTLSSVLIIQCLFFADGGLLALGCNLFNLGFYACFIAYPLIYGKIIQGGITHKKILWGSLLGSLAALQMGALSVVMETLLSGKTELPFGSFVLMMQPIHLAIGAVEGLVTAAILSFVYKNSPGLLVREGGAHDKKPMKRLVAVFAAAALLIGGFFSWFASKNPDGLEWSVQNVTGREELAAQGPVYDAAAGAQDSTALLPDYAFKDTDESLERAGISTAGVTGGIMTLVLCLGVGGVIVLVKRRKKKPKGESA